jgi:multisubunit Na+/H+ antiporter MnhF subunit
MHSLRRVAKLSNKQSSRCVRTRVWVQWGAWLITLIPILVSPAIPTTTGVLTTTAIVTNTAMGMATLGIRTRRCVLRSSAGPWPQLWVSS